MICLWWVQAGADAAVSDRGHCASHPQTAEGEEHQDTAGLLQPADGTGAGAAWRPVRPPGRPGAWHPVFSRVGGHVLFILYS